MTGLTELTGSMEPDKPELGRLGEPLGSEGPRAGVINFETASRPEP